VSNLNKNDRDTFEGLLELVQNTTGKPKEESLAILQKFSTEIQKKLSKNLVTSSEIFKSLDSVTHSQPIYLSNIPFTSLCEHHLLPFFGKFDIAVFPKDKIAGISKFNDLVDYLSNNLTLQEKITQLASEIIQKELEPDGVLTRVRAKHLCSDLMNPKSSTSEVITTFSTGVYELDYSLRAEALENFK
jgi:GTP cyclohydrolase I